MNMTRLFDAHCHLLSDATPVAVSVINNATCPTEWDAVINIASQKSNVFGAIGVHPWFISGLPADWATQMACKLECNPGIMVGEIGLDTHYPDPEYQTSVFVQQLSIAAELGRGIHVHCVGAWKTMLAILSEHKSNLPPFILFHRYGGPISEIERMAHDYNAYFSYGMLSSMSRIKSTPRARILVETDSDTPNNISDVAVRVSQICDTPIETFYNNAMWMIKK